MSDALRVAGLVAMALAAIVGAGLGILITGWICDGLRELEEMFRL